MLVLTRKDNEQICIGDDIVITVIRTASDRVRLGIEAPPRCVILRGELQRTGASPQSQDVPLKESATANTILDPQNDADLQCSLPIVHYPVGA